MDQASSNGGVCVSPDISKGGRQDLRVCAEGVAAMQVGQLLTNLRVSSSNMLLPFTAQIMQLLQDDPQPAGERRQLLTAYEHSSCPSAVQDILPCT